jgi:hypothetical protein
MQFQVMQLQTHTHLQQKKKQNRWLLEPCGKFFLVEMKVWWDKGGLRIVLGNKTGSWFVMQGPIMFQCSGDGISTGHPCTYTYSFPYVYSILTCIRPSGMQLLHKSGSVCPQTSSNLNSFQIFAACQIFSHYHLAGVHTLKYCSF